MPKQNAIGNLTSRDMDVLEILWNSGTSLTTTQISANGGESLTLNTVNAVVRKLLKMEMIEVSEIVYNNTSLCRSLAPTPAAKEKILSFFTSEFHRFHSQISVAALTEALLKNEKDPQKREKELAELEQYLAGCQAS